MSAIASPALALTRAFARVDRASVRVLNAANDNGGADIATSRASTARFADEMWQVLLDLAKERR